MNPSTAESRIPTDLAHVRAGGWLGERIERGMVAVDNLFGSLWWHGSGWGYEHVARWIRNETLYGRYSGRFHPALGSVLEEMLALVADGRAFPDYATHALAAYNEEEFLMGLLSYYGQFPEPRILEAARRLGRSLADHHPVLAGNHYYKSLAIGRLLELAAASGDSSFRDAAVAIAEDQQLAILKIRGSGPDEAQGGTHGAAACMILCWHLELHRTTSERRYLDWATQTWQAIRDRAFITGGLGEHLRFLQPPGEGQDLHDETCQHAWWLTANLRFWSVTGETKYLDYAERILFNHLLFAQLHRGEDAGFCALGNIDQGFRGQHNYICCDNEGVYALLETTRHIVTVDAPHRDVAVNFLIPAEILAALDGQKPVRLRVETDYPVHGRVHITVLAPSAVAFTLRVRMPGGARPASIRVNNKSAAAGTDGSYVVVNRTWADGDMLDVVFPVAMRVEADNTGHGARSVPVVIDGHDVRAKRVGVFHGPVLAAMFRTAHGNDLNWVWTGDYPEALDSGGCVFEDYPTSASDYLESDGKRFHTGRPAERTEIVSTGRAPVISWSHRLAERVRITQKVTVLPGLPVTLDWRQTIEGSEKTDTLLCGGVRFGVAKRSKSVNYGDCAFPYPFPALTTRDDLSANVGFIAGGGSFSLSEMLADGCEVKKTGTFRMSNGSFRAICHYDTSAVSRLVGRVAPEWAGVYFQPVPGERAVLQRRLVFPLYEQPLSQDLTRLERQSVAELTFTVEPAGAGTFTLRIAGPNVQNTPILVPGSTGLKAGWVVHNDSVAAVLLHYDADRLVVRLPAPGFYSVKCQPA